MMITLLKKNFTLMLIFTGNNIKAMGFPISRTVIFAVARTVGWFALERNGSDSKTKIIVKTTLYWRKTKKLINF